MIRRHERLAFFGQTGTGKTELARALALGFASPRVCIDVKDDLGERLPGVPTISEPHELVDLETCRIVPPDPSNERFYDEVYRLAFMRGETLVWLDEANEITSPNYIPKAMRRYILQGRARRCGHFACTPRPADVHPVFAAQAQHVFVFRVRHPRDRAALAGIVGLPPSEFDRWLDDLGDLDAHRFLHFEAATGRLTVCPPAHDPDALTRKVASLYFERPHEGARAHPFGR